MSEDDETAPLLPREPSSEPENPYAVLWWPKPHPPPLWWPWQPDPGPGKIKVEPKVFFANERTFLSWLHFVGPFSSTGRRDESLTGGCGRGVSP